MPRAATRSFGEWTTLPSELLDVILSKLLYTSDYVRFGMVCKSWSFVALNQKQTRIKTQPPMLLFCDRVNAVNLHKHQPFKLYNIEEGKVYSRQLQAPLYPLHSRGGYFGASCGWLVMTRQRSNLSLVELFNPFSQKRIELPPFKSGFFKKVILSCNPTAYPGDYVLGAICWTRDQGYCLALKKAGQKSWIIANSGIDGEVTDIIFHKGLLYALGDHNRLTTIDYQSNSDADDDQLAPAIEIIHSINGDIHKGLVLKLVQTPNYGDLLLVERIHDSTMDGFKVYKLTKTKNTKELSWVEISKFENNGSIFLAGDDNVCTSVYCVANYGSNEIYFADQKKSHFCMDIGFFRMSQRIFCELPEFKVDQNGDWSTIWIAPPILC